MHRCVMLQMSRAASGGYVAIVSQRYLPSRSGRDHAVTIGAFPFAAKNAGAADTGTGCPKNLTHIPPSRGSTDPGANSTIC